MTTRPFKSGESREQASLFPPRIEDYVAADNPVRAVALTRFWAMMRLWLEVAPRRAFPVP